VKKVRAMSASELFVGLILVVLALNISGCGSSGSSSSTLPGNVTIALSQAPPTTLAINGTATISATVTNDSSNAGVDWSCAPAGTCGTFSPAHTASGVTTTYTAPGAAASVTITASSTKTPTATAVAAVTITAGNAVAITLTTAPPSTLLVNGTATVAATVTNDTASAGVDWTCTPTGTCGTFSLAHTASGANTTYTAPAAAVAAVITATATSSHTATATAAVSVTATTTTVTIPAGTYSFYVSGEDSKKNTYAIAGAVAINANGTVTGGEQDYVSAGGATSPEPTPDNITGGTLTIGANSLGTLTLITNNIAVGSSGTETFSFAKVNSKHAIIGEFDAGATSSGSFDLSTVSSPTLAALSGPFVFDVSGKIGSKAEAFGGLFAADGLGGLIISKLDSNEGGAITGGPAGTPGSNTTTYAAPDASGRGTFAFGGNHFVYYMVTAKVLRIVVTDTGEPDIGSAYAGVTGITNASIGGTFVFTDASNLSAGASYAAAGNLTLDGNGNVSSGFADVDESGTATSAVVTGTYTVNANGYGSITLTPGNTQHISVLGLYLADPTINPTDPNSPADAGLRGLLMDLDTTVTGSGWLIVPAAGTPTFTGSFSSGSQSSASNNESDSVGIAAVSGTTFTGTENLNDLFNTGLDTAISVSGTLVPDVNHLGRSTISVLVSLPTNPPTLKYVVYQASSTQFFTIEVDTTEFASGTLQKQQ
jgi:hypothetical protein